MPRSSYATDSAGPTQTKRWCSAFGARPMKSDTCCHTKIKRTAEFAIVFQIKIWTGWGFGEGAGPPQALPPSADNGLIQQIAALCLPQPAAVGGCVPAHRGP